MFLGYSLRVGMKRSWLKGVRGELVLYQYSILNSQEFVILKNPLQIFHVSHLPEFCPGLQSLGIITIRLKQSITLITATPMHWVVNQLPQGWCHRQLWTLWKPPSTGTIIWLAHLIFLQIDGFEENFCLLEYAHSKVNQRLFLAVRVQDSSIGIPLICHGSHGYIRVNFFCRCKFLQI